MSTKIRAHKLVSNFIKNAGLDYSSKEIMSNIQNYGVLIDSVEVKNRLLWVLDSSEVALINWPERTTGSFDKVKILADNQDYLVIFKPVNVVVEAGSGHQKNNLIHWLNQNYNQIAGSEFAHKQPDFLLVNRLDKDTQGILLIAKNLENHQFFQNQFRNRSVVKKYLALVDNYVNKLWITTHYQTRNKFNPLKQKLFWNADEAGKFDPNYRLCSTEIRPLAICKKTKQTLIEVNLKTGRMHQIRLVCEELGFPITLEKLYNKKINPPVRVLQMSFDIQPQTNLDNQNTKLKQKPNLKNEIKFINESELNKIKEDIFLDNSYLLSNYLQILEPEIDHPKTFQIRDIDSYLNNLSVK